MTAAFWAGAAVLAGIVVWMLLPSLLGRRAGTAVEEAGPLGVNIAVLRQQRIQLDADLAAGTLSTEQHRAALEDIERRVLEEEGQSTSPVAAKLSASRGSARAAWALGIAIPVLAAGLYLKLGQPQAITFVAPQAAVTTSGGEQVTQEQVEQMVTQLAERMKERPDDLQGWTMLARSYGALQRYDDASRAYARAIALAPKDAQLLADQADTLAMAQGGTALGEPTKLIERALQVDPNNLKALALAGTAAFERSDHAAAVRYWTRASELVPAGSELAQGLADGLKEARAKLGGEGSPTSPVAAALAAQPPAPAIAATPNASLAQVSGRASLAPAIAAKVAPTDTVFIVARAASGPRMPLAVLRRQVSDLPIQFTLDDSMAMSPEMKLSAFPKVVVIARISKTGSATPSPDDLVVQSAPVDVGQKNIELVIERPAP